MREIKFRAWDVNEKRMRYSRVIDYRDTDGIEHQADETIFVTVYGDVCVYLRSTNGTVSVSFIETGVALEYTGLKDKNGKYIYEGDILRMDILGDAGKYNPEEALRYVVKYQECCWGFRPLFQDLVHEDDRKWRSFWIQDEELIWSAKYFEVIGNIYENPELLKDRAKGSDE